MTWIEFLIIYLACGSPFAVYRAMQIERAVSFGDLAGLLIAFLAWPVFALRILFGEFSKSGDGDDLSRAIRLARTEIEEAAFPTRAVKPLVEFREVFDRYTGLALAVRSDGGPSRELFEISGHARPEVAARIAGRRNREKLLFHHTSARNEFVDLMAGLSLGSDDVVRLASGLAEMLGDTDAVADLKALVLPDTADQPKRSTSAAASVR